MTIWVAYSNLEEKGSLEVDTWADFVLYEKVILKIENIEILVMKRSNSYLKGIKVK
ncbi:hypothetical protein [Flavobacterium frigoris]|uniref:hypothetical protein n=1 Tax=Flavobacterium frigoris TaxID=229204 RepID=UPI001587C7DE|nr:hypothetical protein [Flavobacterium frigoris]